MVKVIPIAVLALLSSSVIADFKITFPQDYKKNQEVIDTGVLLVNNSTEFLIETGSGMASAVNADASRMPISDAFQLLVPKGWRAYGEGVDLKDKTVDLFKGELWTDSFKRAGKDHNMIFFLDWSNRVMRVKPHLEIGVFDASDEPLADGSGIFDTPRRLVLRSGDLRESLDLFAQMNRLKLEVDVYSTDRALRVHPTVAEYTHPIPSCISWSMPKGYESPTTHDWLKELNRILNPYRLKVFLFANDVVFLTSLHRYGENFCKEQNNET